MPWSDTEWQVATNFPLYGRSLEQQRSECRRYDEAWRRFESQRNGFTLDEAMDVLSAISMTEPLETVTSAAYDLGGGRMLLALGRDFQRTWSFWLRPGKEALGASVRKIEKEGKSGSKKK